MVNHMKKLQKKINNMRNLVIDKIIKMNDKYYNKLGFKYDITETRKQILQYATDEFLLETLDILIRFEEELRAKKYFGGK